MPFSSTQTPATRLANDVARHFVGRDAIPLAMILLLALALRWHDLGRASLWHDELFSWYFSQLGFRFQWTGGFGLESTPPLYFALLSLWTKLAGVREVGLRSLSAVANVATIPLVYLLGRELFASRYHALLAALIFALTPSLLYFAQEARTYALLTLAVAVSLLGLARFLRRAAEGGAAALYAIGAVFAVWLHITAAVFVLSANLLVLGLMFWPRDRLSRRHLVLWAVANASVLILSLPLMRMVGSPMVAEDLQHMAPPSVHLFLYVLAQMLVGRVVAGATAYAVAAVFAAALLATLARTPWRAGPGRAVLLVLPVIYLALVVGLSEFRPILVARVMCWLWIPLSLVVAHSLLLARSRWLLLGGTAVLFGVGLFYSFAWRGWNDDDWRDLLAALRPELSHADLVVLAPETFSAGLAYYAPEVGNLRMLDGGIRTTVTNHWIPKRMGLQWVTPEAVNADVRAGQHVVLIARGVEDRAAVARLEDIAPQPRRVIERACGSETCFRVLVW